MTVEELLAAVLELGGGTHVANFYTDNGCCPLQSDTPEAPAQRLERLRDHLVRHLDAPVVLVGEAAGWRGARQTGIPFTSPVQVGSGTTGEASATIVRHALNNLGLVEDVLLWNACLLHPHATTNAESNVAPPARAIDECLQLLEAVGSGKLIVAVGRQAEQAVSRVTGRPLERAGVAPTNAVAVSVRHPSFGGAPAFRQGMAEVARHRYPPCREGNKRP